MTAQRHLDDNAQLFATLQGELTDGIRQLRIDTGVKGRRVPSNWLFFLLCHAESIHENKARKTILIFFPDFASQ